MNAKQKFIILGTTLLLSGCGIYTKYEPQDTVPDNLCGEEAASLSADTTSIADIDWRDFFNDPYLQALIEKGSWHRTLMCKQPIYVSKKPKLLYSRRS